MSMNHPPAKVLMELIVQESAPLLTDPADGEAWPVFVSSMPEKPDDCATIYDTTGVQEHRLMDGTNVVREGFQIRFRSYSYEGGWAKARAVAVFLSGVLNAAVTIGVDTYTVGSVSQSSPVFSLGTEEGTKRRSLFTLNGLVRVEGA